MKSSIIFSILNKLEKNNLLDLNPFILNYSNNKTFKAALNFTEHLSKNLVSKPNIILMHGDLDQVVTIDSFLEAKEFFGKNNYEIETKIFKNCEHRIPTEGSSLGLQFIKKHFKL